MFLKFQNQKRKIPLQTKILWTSGCLVIYLVMGQTPLFGATAPEFDFLAFARVIFASAQGSLVELGIGPIVYWWFIDAITSWF